MKLACIILQNMLCGRPILLIIVGRINFLRVLHCVVVKVVP